MSQRINYDEIAKNYDQNAYRKKDVDLHFQNFLCSNQEKENKNLQILDIGCGTGAQLIANQEAYPNFSYTGLDYSKKMLEMAQRKSSKIKWVQADAQKLPFQDNLFDYISSQYHIHHVPNKRKMFKEVYRVLKPKGDFVIVNSSPFEMKDWIIYRYFPTTYCRDQKDYLPTEDLIRISRKEGFKIVSNDMKYRKEQMNVNDFLEEVKSKSSCSQLAMLSLNEFEIGLKKLEKDTTNKMDLIDFTIAELTLILSK